MTTPWHCIQTFATCYMQCTICLILSPTHTHTHLHMLYTFYSFLPLHIQHTNIHSSKTYESPQMFFLATHIKLHEISFRKTTWNNIPCWFRLTLSTLFPVWYLYTIPRSHKARLRLSIIKQMFYNKEGELKENLSFLASPCKIIEDYVD